MCTLMRYSMERFQHVSTISYEMLLSRKKRVRKTVKPRSQRIININSCADSTLSHGVVSTDLSGAGVCAACSFTNDSTARGCTIELLNDEHMFVFNISRYKEEIALLECFPVPEAGVFSVSVYEILQDGGVGGKVWRLPDVTLPDVNVTIDSEMISPIRKGKIYI